MNNLPSSRESVELNRRWRMVLGVDLEEAPELSENDQRLSAALSALYGQGEASGKNKGRGGLGRIWL